MAVLSDKKFDDELLRRLKASAALQNKTLHEHLEDIVRAAVGGKKA